MFLDAHAPDQPNYGRSEVMRMIRDAKTPEDFDRLADCFDGRAMQFEQKLQDEMKAARSSISRAELFNATRVHP